MSEREEAHDSQDREGESDGEEEVVFRDDAPNVEISTPPTHNASPQMVTADDLQEVIEGWKTKFQHLSEGIRAIQLASDKFNANIDNILRDRRFLERCNPTHLAAARRFDSPVISTPFTPSGAPSRLRPDFNFESPVNQSAPTESTRDNRDHRDNRVHHDNRDHHDTRDHSRDHRYNERPTHEDD